MTSSLHVTSLREEIWSGTPTPLLEVAVLCQSLRASAGDEFRCSNNLKAGYHGARLGGGIFNATRVAKIIFFAYPLTESWRSAINEISHGGHVEAYRAEIFPAALQP